MGTSPARCIPAYRKDRPEAFIEKQKGHELCGLAAPSNESKGFYKSNRRNLNISRIAASGRTLSDIWFCRGIWRLVGVRRTPASAWLRDLQSRESRGLS